MKNSTKSDSSKRVEIRGVKGIIFFDSDLKPRYTTVEAWEKAGKPGDCFVYDGAHQLLAAGIPIVDAIEVENRWVRTHLPAKCPVTLYRKPASLSKKRVRTSTIELKECTFITSSDAAKRKIR